MTVIELFVHVAPWRAMEQILIIGPLTVTELLKVSDKSLGSR